MRFIVRLVLALALLPSTISAAIAPDTEPGGHASPPSGDTPYLVVTDRRLQGSFMALIQARTHGGLPAAVATLEEIEAAYPSGVDLAERIRMFLKDAYANRGTRWVLLGGDASVVPMRRARLRLGSPGDIDLPTDQYYACLDGSWNADGDALWGENPGPGEPGDDVDFFPELFVGRAPVATPAEVADFVRRTLAYEDRLGVAGPRSALLAADVINGIVDGALETEPLRPTLEANPDRQIARLYENAAAWPGALQESRPALLDALDRGHDLAVLVGAGGPGVLVAGQDVCCADYVTSDDVLGLTNGPLYPIVYFESAYTTDPDAPLSIGAALMNARRGGAAAVIGTTDLQFVGLGGTFMDQFFDHAIGSAAPIGEALARAVAAIHSQFVGDFARLTTQGSVLLGDPALRVDAPAAALVSGGRPAFPARVDASGSVGGPAACVFDAAVSDPGNDLTLAITGHDGALQDAPVGGRGRETDPALARLEIPGPSPARSAATLRLDLPRAAAGAPFEVAVFDLLGRRVCTLARGAATEGRLEFSWDLRADSGTPVPSGIYVARLSFAGGSLSRRLAVLR